MHTIRAPGEIDHNRRRLFGTAAMCVAAVQLGIIRVANAQSATEKPKQLPELNGGRTRRSDRSNRSMPARSVSDTPTSVLPTALPSFFCTDGPMTFIVSWTSLPCWRKPATG
jgi:hypothetical protein